MSKCCETPVIITNVNDNFDSNVNSKIGLMMCKSCDMRRIIYKAYRYNCNKCRTKDVETNMILSINVDGKTDWTSCHICEKLVTYRHEYCFLDL
jgi:hypothetical protein